LYNCPKVIKTPTSVTRLQCDWKSLA
jgi:hypothetical protein